MSNLTRASNELFRRSPDECFSSLDKLHRHCREQREQAQTNWRVPNQIFPTVADGELRIEADDGHFRLNDWSFTQLCRLAEVDRGTVNQLSAKTAREVFAETWPTGTKPLQVFGTGDIIRSLHGVTYTRLFNDQVLDVLAEWAEGFVPPQTGLGGGTGLYCGEQDMFCFLIDPTGWVEINGESFAPGLFLWNSEVGRRTVGIQSFWFQAVCQNHIVWGATDVTEFTRKHTSNVGNALDGIQAIIHQLVEKRDARRDDFATIMGKAARLNLGSTVEEAQMVLGKHGFTRALAAEALAIAKEQGRLTVFAVIDALTRISQRSKFAGDRMEADVRAAKLLTLVA